MEASLQMKQEFFVVHDYGMGGAWAIAVADSEAEIMDRFPELQVHQSRPEWMDDEAYFDLRKSSYFKVEDASTYPKWIRTLISERESRP